MKRIKLDKFELHPIWSPINIIAVVIIVKAHFGSLPILKHVREMSCIFQNHPVSDDTYRSSLLLTHTQKSWMSFKEKHLFLKPRWGLYNHFMCFRHLTTVKQWHFWTDRGSNYHFCSTLLLSVCSFSVELRVWRCWAVFVERVKRILTQLPGKP